MFKLGTHCLAQEVSNEGHLVGSMGRAQCHGERLRFKLRPYFPRTSTLCFHTKIHQYFLWNGSGRLTRVYFGVTFFSYTADAPGDDTTLQIRQIKAEIDEWQVIVHPVSALTDFVMAASKDHPVSLHAPDNQQPFVHARQRQTGADGVLLLPRDDGEVPFVLHLPRGKSPPPLVDQTCSV